jgi:hypothetical protein
LSKATVVYCDNISVVYLSTNPVQHQGTKHVEIDLHFVRDRVALGEVHVLHVPTTLQYADIFTKGLPTAVFQSFRSSLNVRSSPGWYCGGLLEYYYTCMVGLYSYGCYGYTCMVGMYSRLLLVSVTSCNSAHWLIYNGTPGCCPVWPLPPIWSSHSNSNKKVNLPFYHRNRESQSHHVQPDGIYYPRECSSCNLHDMKLLQKFSRFQC